MPDELGVAHALVHESGGGGSIVASVIDSVASVRGTDPLSLPPLHGTIDTDALVALLDSTGADADVVTVEFEYAGCRIVVDGSGLIQISDLAVRN